jgi:hypothetical protein
MIEERKVDNGYAGYVQDVRGLEPMPMTEKNRTFRTFLIPC